MKEEIGAAGFLTICAVQDLRTMTVRWEVLGVWGGIIFFSRICMIDEPEIILSFVRQLCIGAVWLLLSRLTGGAFGEGDGGCLLLCGVTVGTVRTVEILLTALIAAAVGAALRILRGENRSCRFPFLPFLAGAAWLRCVVDVWLLR